MKIRVVELESRFLSPLKKKLKINQFRVNTLFFVTLSQVPGKCLILEGAFSLTRYDPK